MIASTATFFFSSIWASYAASYGSLMGARVIQSFGASASEAIVPAIVADIFFLHERGRWIGFCAFMIAVGNALGAVFAGLVATATGDWRWVWHMNMIVTGFAFLLVIFLYPETNFKRPAENETEGMSPSDLQALRAQTTSTWIKSLSVTGWYDRYGRINAASPSTDSGRLNCYAETRPSGACGPDRSTLWHTYPCFGPHFLLVARLGGSSFNRLPTGLPSPWYTTMVPLVLATSPSAYVVLCSQSSPESHFGLTIHLIVYHLGPLWMHSRGPC